MKLIESSYEIIEQLSGLDGIYEQIELAGRTCYKSKRPEGQTAKDFVDKMIASGHCSMLEHGTVYLYFSWKGDDTPNELFVKKYVDNPYSKVMYWGSRMTRHNYFITTNFRTIVENGWLDDLKYLCEPTEYHEKRVTVKFITSIGIGRELTRHRKFSFAQESTRYCNYTNEAKFGNELTFVHDFDDITVGQKEIYQQIEAHYKYLIGLGLKAQEVRDILPLGLKSELIMTGFVSDWKYLFELRSSIAKTGKPHPNMIKLIDPLMEEFNKRYNE